MKRACIVGAGIAGTYLAIALARQGFEVTLCERKPLENHARPVADQDGRSIAMALSHRGLKALSALGLQARATELSRRMLGRGIHLESGQRYFSPYDPTGQGRIHAIARADLMDLLFDAARREPLIDCRFGEEVVELRQTHAWVAPVFRGGASPHRYDLLIGADGAASSVRDAFQSEGHARFHRQDFGCVYKEVPLAPAGAEPFDAAALHIWPRGPAMLIGLPGKRPGHLDGTLFLPHRLAQSWCADASGLAAWFRELFPEVAMDPEQAGALARRTTGRICTIQGGPWHHGRAVLVGDAAHAMTPFLGQGMNCALEDCELLLAQLQASRDDPARAFSAFDAQRRADADAIAALSVMNCQEMMEHTRTSRYARRKQLEAWLTARYPQFFVPHYALVTFGSTAYSQVLRLKTLQDRLLDRLLSLNISDADLDRPCALALTEMSHYQGEAALLLAPSPVAWS